MYKKSFYNFRIPYNNGFVYYNSKNGSIFHLNKSEDQKIQELLEDPIYFEIYYPSVFTKFVEWGFLYNDDIAEIDALKYRYKEVTLSDKHYNLVINPTLECNFSCWYCYQDHQPGYMNEEIVGRVKKHLVYMIEKEKITGLHLSWFGGEPLLYFDSIVCPITLFAKEVCAKNNIPFASHATTNASLMDEGMIQKMQEVSLNSFQITIDGSPQRHNKIRNEKGAPSFERIMNNIVAICETIDRPNIILRVNYDEQTLKDESLKDVFKNIPEQYRKFIRVDFQQVWQIAKKTDGENLLRIEYINLCRELGFIVYELTNAFFFVRNKSYRCYADRKYHAEINYDGKVYSCTAEAYTDFFQFGILTDTGEIQYQENKLIKKLAKAPFENEMCLSCKYLPVCWGPCSKKAMTHKGDLKGMCILTNIEVQPERMILDLYERRMSK